MDYWKRRANERFFTPRFSPCHRDIVSFRISLASHRFISDLKLNWNFRIDLEDRFAYRFEVDVYFSQDVNYEARQPYRWFYEPTYNFSGIRGGRERRAKPQVAVRELINGGGKSTMFSLASCARIAIFFFSTRYWWRSNYHRLLIRTLIRNRIHLYNTLLFRSIGINLRVTIFKTIWQCCINRTAPRI